MAVSPERMLRCTVHWLEQGQPRQQDLLFPDRPIAELIPMLVESLGLAAAGESTGFGLRPAPRAAAWPVEQSLAAVGVRDGGHIWIAPTPAAPRPLPAVAQRPTPPRPCALLLPGGQRVPLPAQGQPITRGWLLQQLAPGRQRWEQIRFRLGRSPFQAVSASAPHCQIRPTPAGGWVVETARDDVLTWLNGALLAPNQPAPLRDGDTLQPGAAAGPRLVVRLG